MDQHSRCSPHKHLFYFLLLLLRNIILKIENDNINTVLPWRDWGRNVRGQYTISLYFDAGFLTGGGDVWHGNSPYSPLLVPLFVVVPSAISTKGFSDSGNVYSSSVNGP